MTTNQGFRLVTRALAVACLIWFLSDAIALPTDLLGLIHYVRMVHLAREMGKFIEEENYWIRYYSIRLCELLIGMGIALLLARWFYRGGVSVRRFFLPETDLDAVE
jgi:hypothetical protein